MQSCAVIPAYNSARSIGSVVCCARSYLDEILVVDDGSDDDTGQIAERAGAVVLTSSQNQGKAHALRVGAEEAIARGFDMIVTIDSDGEHDPSDSAQLLARLYEGYSVVLGVRGNTHSTESAGQRATQKILCQHFGIDIADAMCGFRAYTRISLAKLLAFSTAKRFGIDFELAVLTAVLGISYAEQPISSQEQLQYPGVRATHMLDFAKNLIRFQAIHSVNTQAVFGAGRTKFSQEYPSNVILSNEGKTVIYGYDPSSGFYLRE